MHFVFFACYASVLKFYGTGKLWIVAIAEYPCMVETWTITIL